MFKLSLLATALALSFGIWSSRAATPDAARVPVLLELFTSEGCSSCPPADKLLAEFDQQPVPGAELIVLSEHVDYWNRLGWTDPFSAAQYSERQQDYTNKYRLDGVYTPQLVIDGHIGLVGSDRGAAASAIRNAVREPKAAIQILRAVRDAHQVTASIVIPGAGFKQNRAILYAALADNRAESRVARGENSGRSLAHVSVARILQQLGPVDLSASTTKDVTLSIPPGASGDRLVVFVQDARTGHVLGSAMQKL